MEDETSMYMRKSRNEKAVGLLALCLVVCMVLTGIPFENLRVKASDTATVTNIYATFPENGDPTDFEVAEEGCQTQGKDLFGRIVRDGTYTVSSYDAEGGLPLYLDNATATYPQGVTVNPYSIYMSGNSSLITDTCTVSSTSDAFDGGSVTTDNIADFLQFYEDRPPYSYTFTSGETVWTNWIRMETLTVNQGVTLKIACGQDGEDIFSATIETGCATINGTVIIEDSAANGSNALAVEGGGTLIIGENGSLTGAGNAVLEIRDYVTVTGSLPLYDRFDGESGQWIAYVCDGSQDACTGFSYDSNESKWVRIADGGGLGDFRYRIVKIGDGENSLTVNGSPSEFDDENSDREFERDTPINFTVTGEVYKVIVVGDEFETEPTGTNGSYSYTPTADSGFEILIYTSEEAYHFDRCQPGEGEFLVEYQVRYQDEETAGAGNQVAVDSQLLGSNLVCSAYSGEWTRLVLKDAVTEVPLKITAAQDCDYEVMMHGESGNNDVTQDVKDNQNVLNWDVTAKDRSDWPEVYFKAEGNDGPGPDEPGPDEPDPGREENLQEYIENQGFAFGDWNEDGGVDGADVKLGMAYQIFYPKFDQSQKLREEYGVATYDALLSKIEVTRASDKDLSAKDASDTERTIPAYTYRVTLTKQTNEGSETVEATGTAYALSFTDDSVYRKNNRGCILAETEKDGNKSYFLRCANAYTAGTQPDTTTMVSGENPNEAPILIVSDFDVRFDEQTSTYDRKVRIFGNGVALDTLISQEEDTDIVAYQGRNENFMRDIGKINEPDWGCVFSVFTFCQKSFAGVQVKGSGANGNTPSWSYHQYPVYSTDDANNTEKEAFVYFGNKDVFIKPVDGVGGLDETVTGIASVTLADPGITSDAVEIQQQSNTEWKVVFHSDFYDQVKVKIVYDLQGGGTKTAYLNIHRVGIDILSGNGSDNMTLFHGTDNGPSYDAAGKELVIWGTYYYPQVTTDPVDLYVTYTWSDRSVTKRTIHNDPSLNMDYDQGGSGNCQSSDFILYEGSEAGAPTQIEAIAVVSGFDNTSSNMFSGAKFGSGKGVNWKNYGN